MDNTKLFRIQEPNPSPYDRIREAISQPVGYFAPTIKSILDERDLVPKTRGRIFNPGLYLNGGILIYMPTACFRWREPFRTFKEVSAFLDDKEREYNSRIDLIETNFRNSTESEQLLKQVIREMVIHSFEIGRLYDGVTELPICPTISLGENLSNGQRLYHVLMGYKPFSIAYPKILATSLISYRDHLDVPTSDKATKTSLADLVRGMVPQLEPTG